MITIRRADENDYAAIYGLNRDGLGYNYPLEKTQSRLESILKSNHNVIFVAETENGIVGYIHLEDYDCTYSDSLKNILALVVNPSFHRQGIGRRLLNAAEEYTKKDGANGIRLVSGFDRTGAHRFYEACGYTSRKDQKNFIKVFAD